jgi:hypothetical protein
VAASGRTKAQFTGGFDLGFGVRARSDSNPQPSDR